MGMQYENENNPTFFVDAMLGNIAKKLRLMGYDSKYEADIQDEDLIKLAKQEQRTIVSRDENLVKKALKLGIKSIFIEKNEEVKQLREIIDKQNLTLVEINGDRARCPLCNTKTKSINKDSVKDKIPVKILEQNEKFWECANCRKIFWEGSHIKNLQKFVSEINER